MMVLPLTTLPVHAFGYLGFAHRDGYYIDDNCNAVLETILYNLRTEDKCLRPFRKSISFYKNVNRDLIPLLLNAKDDKTIELLIQVLENLTTPIGCLFSGAALSTACKSTVWELNTLLLSSKTAFSDHRTTNVLIEFLEKNVKGDSNGKLSEEQCAKIGSVLLLLSNILHTPEPAAASGPGYSARATTHATHNQIVWNIFSEGFDKILIKLMRVAEATNWGNTVLELLAILYKDQQKQMLQKWLSMWLRAPLQSDSSESDESDTALFHTDSDDSSRLTMDSAGSSGNSETNGNHKQWAALLTSKETSENDNQNQAFQTPPSLANKPESMATTSEEPLQTKNDEARDCGGVKLTEQVPIPKNDQNSDCGRGLQVESQQSISMDELRTNSPVRQKSRYLRKRKNSNQALDRITLKEIKRRKLVEREKCNITNMQRADGVSHKAPTDEDIFNILKEFTIDFLLKGFNSLVETLHKQILSNSQLRIDMSLFLWLVSYFLSCATQLELDLKHVSYVLSYDMVSYLTVKGVHFCEQFRLAVKLKNKDLSTCELKLCLIVTVILEFVRAIDKMISYIDEEGKKTLSYLKMNMWETEELRSLFVLLLRQFNQKYNSKHYLQHLIVTNHILLSSLNNVVQLPNHKGSTGMLQHVKKFTAPEMMFKYALLLEDYFTSTKFVNGCIFTMMHHVGSKLGCVSALHQPKILSIFASIRQTKFQVCDDVFELIKNVIHTYTMKKHKSFKEDKILSKPVITPAGTVRGNTEAPEIDYNKYKQPVLRGTANDDDPSEARWTQDEHMTLTWVYLLISESQDLVGDIVKLLKEDSVSKSRKAVIEELYEQKLINKEVLVALVNKESERNAINIESPEQAPKETKDDEIRALCQQLSEDGKFIFLEWVQKVLLDTCFAYICRHNKTTIECNEAPGQRNANDNKKMFEDPVVSPLAYHCRVYRQSVPLVPWSCEQSAVCKDHTFLHLLHKLGFQMPHETGQVFIRIPHFWTAGTLYDIASKIAPIDTTKLKFSVNDVRLEENIPDTSANQET